MSIITIYVVIAALLLVTELLYFRLADRYNIIDKPNERSSHKRVVLRGGGIIFLMGAWIWASFFGVKYPWFLCGLTLVGAVSFADDVKSLPDSVRLVAQFAAMLLMFRDFGILHWESWWIIVLALILCVGISNAYNFMDGINGITGGYSIAVLLPLACLNRHLNFIDESFLAVALLSLLTFCLFNFRKRAKCFAGDVGSLSIAFIVLFALGRLILATGDFTYIVFLAVYGADTVLTICHRIMLRENLGQAHRKHAYQIMANELHIPHVIVAGVYATLQLAVSIGFILWPFNNFAYLCIVVTVLAAAYVLFMKRYYHLHEAYLKTTNA